MAPIALARVPTLGRDHGLPRRSPKYWLAAGHSRQGVRDATGGELRPHADRHLSGPLSCQCPAETETVRESGSLNQIKLLTLSVIYHGAG